MWNGAAEALKPSPAMIMASPPNGDARQFRQTIAADRIRNDAVAVRRLDVERDGEAEGDGVAKRAERGGGGLACRGRDEDCAEQRQGGRTEQRVDGRDRE